MGQISSELLDVLDIILRRVRNNDTFLGGMMILCTMDHTQLQPINGRPFLTSVHVIPCFRMIELKTSVRASDDVAFQRIQEICRFSHRKLKESPNLVDEFLDLCSNHLTFVPNWTDPAITTNTYRLYSKKVPAKEAALEFIQRVRRQILPHLLRVSSAHDIERNRFSHLDWQRASADTKSYLNTHVKEQETLLLFKGAVYEFTYNNDGYFSQAQSAILYDLPSQEDIDRWRKIPVLAAPTGTKDIHFGSDATKESYLALGFTEVKVGPAPERLVNSHNIQSRRKQYGLKHRVTSTIHAAMGDTLCRMATEVSRTDPNFSVWDKGQLVVVLSRTKLARNTIFVGIKEETLAVFKEILLRKTQWSDYIEDVLDVVTLSPQDSEVQRAPSTPFTQQSFPLRICDVSLPQCRTGYVYLLISLKNPDHTFFGETICLRTRIQKHNSGYGADGMNTVELRPFAILAYICGFNGDKHLRQHVCNHWMEKKYDLLMNDGVSDPHQWALGGQNVIDSLHLQQQTANFADNVDGAGSELKLVCLFRPTNDNNT